MDLNMLRRTERIWILKLMFRISMNFMIHSSVTSQSQIVKIWSETKVIKLINENLFVIFFNFFMTKHEQKFSKSQAMKVVSLLSCLVFVIFILSKVHANSYKFIKIENYASSNENVFKINSLEVSSTRLNFTYDIIQPFTKIFVCFTFDWLLINLEGFFST